MRRWLAWALGLWAALGAVEPVLAQTAASVEPLAGRVEYRLAEDTEFRALPKAIYLPATAYVRTGADGLAAIRYTDDTHITVKAGSLVQVGGVEESLWVSLGSVLVRAAHLLDDSADRQVRTPVAVAAVRGTEFGVSVDDGGLTRVFVFSGRVAVRNVQLPDEVLVTQGRMTLVAAMRPPTAPTPFVSGDFEGQGGTGGLERAEDPVLESTEEPAVDSWLAFADHDIDALRDPAYLVEVRHRRSTTLLTGGLRHSRDWIDEGTGRRDAEHVNGDGQVGQHVSLLPLGGVGVGGLFLEGTRSHDDIVALRHGLFDLTGERRRQITDRRVGRVQAMLARRWGGHDLGLGIGYRHSRTEAEDRLVDTGDTQSSDESTDLGRLQLGWVGRGQGRSLALAWTHDISNASGTSTPQQSTSDGRVDAWEAMYRRRGDGWSRAFLLRAEWSRTDEQFTEDGAVLYDETLRVKALRLGSGVGLTPTHELVIGADAVAGFSQEEAKQRLPAGGGVREDEDDRLVALSLHLGVQYFVRPWLVLTTDVGHLLQRQSKTFDVLPGTADAARREESTTGSTTTALTGVGYVQGAWRVQYFVRSGDATLPLSHNLLLVMSMP